MLFLSVYRFRLLYFKKSAVSVSLFIFNPRLFKMFICSSIVLNSLSGIVFLIKQNALKCAYVSAEAWGRCYILYHIFLNCQCFLPNLIQSIVYHKLKKTIRDICIFYIWISPICFPRSGYLCSALSITRNMSHL